MTGVARVPRIIKRYQNRKLYDTEARRYVSLERVERLIREGVEVSVLDAATGADFTPVILTEILLTRERKGQTVLPALFLHPVDQIWRSLGGVLVARLSGDGRGDRRQSAGRGAVVSRVGCSDWTHPAADPADAEDSPDPRTENVSGACRPGGAGRGRPFARLAAVGGEPLRFTHRRGHLVPDPAPQPPGRSPGTVRPPVPGRTGPPRQPGALPRSPRRRDRPSRARPSGSTRSTASETNRPRHAACCSSHKTSPMSEIVLLMPRCVMSTGPA